MQAQREVDRYFNLFDLILVLGAQMRIPRSIFDKYKAIKIVYNNTRA